MIHITTERAASTGERGSLENQSPNEFISGANEVLLSAVYEGDQNKTWDEFNQGRCGAICGAFPFPVRTDLKSVRIAVGAFDVGAI